jgi:hypothetical protein
MKKTMRGFAWIRRERDAHRLGNFIPCQNLRDKKEADEIARSHAESEAQRYVNEHSAAFGYAAADVFRATLTLNGRQLVCE